MGNNDPCEFPYRLGSARRALETADKNMECWRVKFDRLPDLEAEEKDRCPDGLAAMMYQQAAERVRFLRESLTELRALLKGAEAQIEQSVEEVYDAEHDPDMGKMGLLNIKIEHERHKRMLTALRQKAYLVEQVLAESKRKTFPGMRP